MYEEVNLITPEQTSLQIPTQPALVPVQSTNICTVTNAFLIHIPLDKTNSQSELISATLMSSLSPMKPSPIALPAFVVPERQPLSQETQYHAASMTKNQIDALKTYLTENLPTEAALLAISILGIAVENYET